MAEDVLIGRYELGKRVGSGGMSTVVQAFDRRLERNVAVKLLAEHLADDPQFVQRFQREAKSAARLVHPNIVQVFDYGFDPDKGRYYIVMELVEGRSGAQLLAEHGRLSVDATLHLADGACRALAHAHRHGVIHRDVKPGNIMLADDGQVKLADFGIAWAGDALQVTQHGAVLGTVAYLAPEQASGEKASPQADIYGLGVVTFQLMTGRLPFAGQSLSELVLAQRDQRPPPLDKLVTGVPHHVAVAVASALSYDPADRPESAEALHAMIFGSDRTAATRISVAEDATAMTQLGDGDRTEVTRLSRRAALTGRSAAAPAAAAASATGVQRLQPRASSNAAPAGAAGRAPMPAPGRQTKAPAKPAKPAKSFARQFLTLVAVAVVLAGAGAAFGVWLGDSMSGLKVIDTSSGDLGQMIDSIKAALGQ